MKKKKCVGCNAAINDMFCVYFSALVIFTALFLSLSRIPLQELQDFSSQAAAMGVCVGFYSLFNAERMKLSMGTTTTTKQPLLSYHQRSRRRKK